MDMEKQTRIMDPKFKARLVKSLSQIDNQIQRCKRLTQNLLRFSRRTQPMIQTVDLNEFIKEVIELMEREAGTSGVKILSDMEENLPTVVTDPSQLQQVFLNLTTNAIDAHDGKPYGSIRISTRSNDTDRIVRIVFADTGSGISEENMEKIFDPFFTTKPVGRGTGLGLSICYSIVRRLGGDITVRSETGSGTEFTIILPYNPPPELKESIADSGLA